MSSLSAGPVPNRFWLAAPVVADAGAVVNAVSGLAKTKLRAGCSATNTESTRYAILSHRGSAVGAEALPQIACTAEQHRRVFRVDGRMPTMTALQWQCSKR